MNVPFPQAPSQRLASRAAAQCLLVCSDCDGTLAPRLEQAQLLPGAFDILHDLARLPGSRVATTSGRSRDNLLDGRRSHRAAKNQGLER
jgi:hypothetical protein